MFDAAPGQGDVSSSPPSKMKSFTVEGQPDCSPREQHASRRQTSTVDAAMGGPEFGDKTSTFSTTAAMVQKITSTMNRVPDQLGVWRTPAANISRSSSSPSDIEIPVEKAKVAAEGGGSTGASKPFKVGQDSVRLLPGGTGSAMDRGERAQSRSNWQLSLAEGSGSVATSPKPRCP